jgi:hypothetical protein
MILEQKIPNLRETKQLLQPFFMEAQSPFVVLEKLYVVVVIFINRFKDLVDVFFLQLCRTHRPAADYPEQFAIVNKPTVNPGFLVLEKVYLFFPCFETPGQDDVT